MVNDPVEQIRSIPGRMLTALSWHGISYPQAPPVFQHFGLPIYNLAHLVDPVRMLENLSTDTIQKFARTHTVAMDWLLAAQGPQVASNHLNFNPANFIQQAVSLKEDSSLLGIYLLSIHHRMSPVQFTPVRPVLQLPHPVLGPGFPVYELWPVFHWNNAEERLLLKGAFRSLLRILGSGSLAPQGVMLDGSIAHVCFDDYMHPAQAILEYNVVDWDLQEALGGQPEAGEWAPGFSLLFSDPPPLP